MQTVDLSATFAACVRMLDLERPLVFIDLETTGTDVETDRIIEVGLVALNPDGVAFPYTTLVNPGIPVPPAVVEITGIDDDMLAGACDFEAIAPVLNDFLSDADVAGYNLVRFDLPLLEREFTRCGVAMERPPDRQVLDAYQIFRKFEPHTLERAIVHYTGRVVRQSHRALNDVLATADVIAAQLARYGLAGPVGEVSARVRHPFLDGEGKLKEESGDVVFCFGKHSGRTLAEVLASDPGYVPWAIGTIGGEFGKVLSALVRASDRAA